MNMARRPIQKVGSEKVTSDAVTEPVSKADPLLAAVSTPRRRPINRATVVDTPKSSRVFASLPVEIISCVIEFPVW